MGRWGVTDAVVSYFHGTYRKRGGIDAGMNLAPSKMVIGAMLLRLSFTFAQHLDVGAVEQQMQASRGGYNFNGNPQYRLTPAHNGVIRNMTIQACQPG